MVRILHFADAHIDMANYGRHDPQTGLPMRVMDFLKSLDEIVDTAIQEKVDLVLFAGDAYKDRSPAPTFQREWGKRILRLSKARIPTLLLVGNHDLAPALGRANAIEEFNTLEVPLVKVIDKPALLKPADLWDLPLQVIAIPWISRSRMLAQLDIQPGEAQLGYEEMVAKLEQVVKIWLTEAGDSLPIVLTAHASLQGATYGYERTVMLGTDLIIPGAVVRDPRLDYVAMGHIHKSQDLNEGSHPPIIYPGSIERVDFGEADQDKFFVIAEVDRGKTRVDWRKLKGIRPFINRFVRLTEPDRVMELLLKSLPAPEAMEGAVVRLMIEYPREYEPLIDENELRSCAEKAFEFYLVKRPQSETRVRLPDNQQMGSLGPMELLDLYWRASHVDEREFEQLNKLAQEIFSEGEEEG